MPQVVAEVLSARGLVVGWRLLHALVERAHIEGVAEEPLRIDGD